jgi:hypothetical protein
VRGCRGKRREGGRKELEKEEIGESRLFECCFPVR